MIEPDFPTGWASQYGAGVEDRGKAARHDLLSAIPTALIGVGGSKERTYEKYGYDEAMRTQLDCGINDVDSHLTCDVRRPTMRAIENPGAGDRAILRCS